MKYIVRQTTRFRKELKKMLKRGAERAKLSAVVKMLAMGTPSEIQENEAVRTAYLGHKKAKEA